MQKSKIVTGVVTKKPKLKIQQDGVLVVIFWVTEDYFDGQGRSSKNYYFCSYPYENPSFVTNLSEKTVLSVEGHFEVQPPSQYKYHGHLKNIVILSE